MMSMFRFKKSSRLLKQRQFKNAYVNGKVVHLGPIKVHVVANELAHNRLGLSVPKRAGNAVMRNRIKRMLREAFRSIRNSPVQGVDVVVTVRQHTPFSADRYQSLLIEAIDKSDR